MPVAISGLHDVAAGLCVYVSDRPRSRVGYKGDVRGTIPAVSLTLLAAAKPELHTECVAVPTANGSVQQPLRSGEGCCVSCVWLAAQPRTPSRIRVNTDVAPSPMIIIDRVRVTREVIIERGPSEEGPGGAPSGTAHTGTNK